MHLCLTRPSSCLHVTVHVSDTEATPGLVHSIGNLAWVHVQLSFRVIDDKFKYCMHSQYQERDRHYTGVLGYSDSHRGPAQCLVCGRV